MSKDGKLLGNGSTNTIMCDFLYIVPSCTMGTYYCFKDFMVNSTGVWRAQVINASSKNVIANAEIALNILARY